MFKAINLRPLILVDKSRQTWLYKDYEIAIDKVAGLGDFVEIEYKGKSTKFSPKEITAQMIKFLKGLKLGLPHLKSVTLPLADFLANHKEIFSKQLPAGEYHVSLVSVGEGKKRFRNFPLDSKHVLDYIANTVPRSGVKYFTLILREFFPNLYGGNILISREGNILLEAVEGEHLGLVTGKKTPTIFGFREPFTRAIGIYRDMNGQNRLEDLDLEQLFLKTINSIPHDQVRDDGKMDFHPGYYEFVVVRKGKTGLIPLFIDYRDREIYQL